MKLKRYIALTLCALYIAATASVSLASVTCKCLDLKRVGTEHLCPMCCSMHDPSQGGTCVEGLLGSDCDCNRHSTRIDLYTSSHVDDTEKYVRCIVAVLPPSLAVECPSPQPFPAAAYGDAWRAEALLHDVVAECAGRRAPPCRG